MGMQDESSVCRFGTHGARQSAQQCVLGAPDAPWHLGCAGGAPLPWFGAYMAPDISLVLSYVGFRLG